jgi:hypothetical protein
MIPVAAHNQYKFTKTDMIPDFRVSPVSCVPMTLVETGIVQVASNAAAVFTVETGARAGTEVNGGVSALLVEYAGYQYRRP